VLFVDVSSVKARAVPETFEMVSDIRVENHSK
jgi:hypothetical protein